VNRFREEGTRLVAQRNNPACQRDDERIRVLRQRQSAIWFGRQIADMTRLASEPGVDFSQDRPTADIVFDDRLDLELGGLRLELLSVPGGETIDSCVLWLPDHGILFCGNLFGPLFGHFPNFNTLRGDRYRFVEPYLKSLERVRALEPEMLITGRFDPIAGRVLIRSCLDRLEAAVSYVHDATLAGMNRGADIWALMREIELPDSLFVGQGYGKVSWCVRTIWESYMGWFKAQATSELYATQPREIHAELVALAGIDAVVARGGEKLCAGDPEAACLFAEAALAHAPRDPDALRLSLDAHRALLARSEARNFWETGWLENEIARLQRTI
jgi:alkyl sulfatase BDS1-like metallo-beta-lactamase superfamily hydrolase